MPTRPTKAQQAAWNRTFYQRHKEARVELNRRKRAEIREFIEAYKREHPCPCGEAHVACLQFHHTDPREKDFEIGLADRHMWSLERLHREMQKCQVLCANCHAKLHWQERREPVAQLVEQRTFNPWVVGSNPTRLI